MSNWLFQDRTWPQIKQAAKDNVVLLLPLGQTEEHGTHLQVGCDTIIAEHVARATADRLDGQALVLPSIPYAYIPKAMTAWPVFRVRWDVMINFIADVCTSAVESGFQKLIIISTHGPNGDLARTAAREVFDRTGIGPVVSIPHNIVAKRFNAIRRSTAGGTSHAGEYETSLLMHFGYPVDLTGLDDRDRVKVHNEWVGGDMLFGGGRVSWSTWALQVSETGTLATRAALPPKPGARHSRRSSTSTVNS